VRERGTLEEGMTAAKKIVSASYEVAYIQHAPMEPRAAVAEWQDGRLTVWTGTQQPARVQRELAEAFRIPQERVRVIVPDTGGAFGGKHTGDAAVEAARLAKGAGRPVSLRWTREEEFTWAYFRPAALIETKAGLAADGKLLAWECTNFNSGASARESPYEIAHARETFRYCESPLREGSYRVLAATANNFARESFMDELAAAGGADPLDYRLACLKNERLRAVLEAAAERFRWSERRQQRQEGRGIGLACGSEKGSYVAACVEVEADKAGGSLRVLEICEAYECGAIQNPGNLRAQVEGCIIMTLGGALTEDIRFEDGRILNGRFSQYPVPRFKDVPAIVVALLNRTDLPSVGAGETPMIAVPPAIGNAVFDACGVRLRSMPLRGEALRRA
jgi:isoquinoline 1-oxidoreductase